MLAIQDVLDHRFVIRAFIGSGATAYVYRAYDQVLHRDVAIKIMREEMLENQESNQNFITEAQLLADLRHIHIVRIYALGYIEKTPYIVCEFLHSPTLSFSLQKQGFYPVEEAINIITQLLEAVQFTHGYGVIHRDIKPQNIFYSMDGTVKLGDFGIATYTGISTDRKQKIFGSLPYLAPEVIQGKNPSISSDLYAIGITFYELLTGHVPFEGQSKEEIAKKHIRSSLPDIKRKDVPEWIKQIIRCACAKSPEDRYPSAAAFLEALQHHEPESKKKLSFFQKWWRRKK